MIHLTEKAVGKLKEISEGDGIGHFTVRVRVVGGGCAGFTYDMYYEDKIGEMDEIIEQDGVKVVVDPLSLQYLEDVTIDYLDGPFGAGFKFINPNTTGSCGCGSSFSM